MDGYELIVAGTTNALYYYVLVESIDRIENGAIMGIYQSSRAGVCGAAVSFLQLFPGAAPVRRFLFSFSAPDRAHLTSFAVLAFFLVYHI
jgi:hypothetical protein